MEVGSGLTLQDIRVALRSLAYSLEKVRDNPEIPYEIRKQYRAEIEQCQMRLRELRDQLKLTGVQNVDQLD